MQTVMKSNYGMNPMPSVPRSTFDRSHGRKTVFNADELIPIYADLAYPGDVHKCDLSSFVRLATQVVPVMDNLYVDYFFFAVPMRLVWSNTKKFFGERIPNPSSSTDFLIPVVTAPGGGFTVGGLHNHLYGTRPGIAGYTISNLWARAYNLCWNEWFRDQNLQDSVTVDLDDGPDTVANYVIKKRNKAHDYFTSCLPTPQLGPAVSLPIGSTAPVTIQNTDFWTVKKVSDQTTVADQSGFVSNGSARLQSNPYGGTVYFDPGASLHANLSAATSATLNSVRNAFALQQFLERQQRGGTRYTEIIRSFFGVISPDARQQRPELIGYGSSPVNVHPVAQSSVSAATPQGNLAAFATASPGGKGFVYSATEHTLILGMVCVRADITYQQGIERIYTDRDNLDMYWPDFAHLGEQAVKNKEIFVQGTSADDLVFGYQEAWAHLRTKPSTLTGLMQSDAPSTLDVWNLSQKFTALPALNSTFIESTTPLSRILAVPSAPQFIADFYLRLHSTRAMPTRSIPGLRRL